MVHLGYLWGNVNHNLYPFSIYTLKIAKLEIDCQENCILGKNILGVRES